MKDLCEKYLKLVNSMDKVIDDQTVEIAVLKNEIFYLRNELSDVKLKHKQLKKMFKFEVKA